MFISTGGWDFSETVFKFQAYAQPLPELVGEECMEGGDSAKTVSDMLHHPASIPRLSILSQIGSHSISI